MNHTLPSDRQASPPPVGLVEKLRSIKNDPALRCIVRMENLAEEMKAAETNVYLH